jgi:spore germination protein YaaH
MRKPQAAARAALVASATLLAGCSSAPTVPAERAEVWAFTAPWDARSARSVATHAVALDVVVSGWYALDTLTGRGIALYPDSFVSRLPAGTRAFALTTTFVGDQFHPATLRALGADPARRGEAVGELARTLSTAGYRGAVLDFESLAPTDLDTLVIVARAMRDSLHAHGVPVVALAIPAGDTLGYPTRPLLEAVDLLVVMLYDQHWANSPPGPIASPEWARRLLQARTSDAGADRIVAAFPLYGYAWRAGASDVVGFGDAQRLAGERGLLLTRDPASSTLQAASVAPNEPWQTWVSDAVLVDSLIADARGIGVRRFALWRLGLEDPAVWNLLGRNR